MTFQFCLGQLLTEPNKPSVACGTDESKISAENLAFIQNAQKYINQKRASRTTVSPGRVARIAIEVDYPTYQLYNGDTNLIKKEAILQISQVSKVYERDMNIKLVVTCFNFWTTAQSDPYFDTSDIYAMLDRLYYNWNPSNINGKLYKLRKQYDKVIYLTAKSFSGAGGVAYLGGRESVCPWGLGNLNVIAHELGHNFGSPHTQSCSWPGGPIDYCYAAEGACYEKSLEIIKGSIMSYCQAKDEFHPLCQAVMEQHASSNMQEITGTVSNVLLPSFFAINTNPFFVWDASIMADQYVVQVALDTDFKQVISQDTTNSSYIQLANLEAPAKYYLRVMATNKLGKSGWSNVCTLIIAENSLLPPSTNAMPFYWTTFDAGKLNTIKITPSVGAKSYEVQFAYVHDNTFSNPCYSLTFTGSENSFYIGSFYYRMGWRIRAINETTKSAWSDRKVIFAQSSYQNPVTTQVSNPSIARTITTDEAYTAGESVAKLSIVKTNSPNTLVYQKKYAPTSIANYGYIYKIPALENSQSYTVTYELSRDKENPLSFYPKGVLNSRSVSFVNKTSSVDSNLVKYQGFDNELAMQTSNANAYMATNHLAYLSYGGLVLINTLTGQKLALNNNTSGGSVGARATILYGSNNQNQSGVITQVSKRISYQGSFPANVYALNILDNTTGNLVSSTILNTSSDFNPMYLDVSNNYLIGTLSNVSGLVFYKISGSNLNRAFNIVPTSSEQARLGNLVWNKDYVWQAYIFSQTNKASLKRFNTNDGSSVEFIGSTMPELAAPYITTFLDSKNRLWASNTNGVLMYDGNTWSLNKAKTGNIISPRLFAENSAGDIFAWDSNRILQYTGGDWKILANVEIQESGLRKMLIDNNGLFWFAYDGYVVRYNTCTNTLSTPSFSASNNEIEYGQQVSLKAEGCAQTQWTWNNKKDTVASLTSSNLLTINPVSTTTFTAKCYFEGCSGTPTTTNVTVIPVLRLDSLSKACYSQPIKVYGRILGDIDANTSFSQVIQANGKDYTLKSTQQTNSSQTVWQSETNNISTGTFTLRIDAGTTKMAYKDTLKGTIYALPVIKLVTDTACVGETLAFKATGAKSYDYTFNQKVYANANGTLEVPNATSAMNQLLIKVKGTDVNGCANLDSAKVLVNDLPNITITAPNQVYQTQTLELKASGANNYAWTGPAGFTSSVQNPSISSVDSKYSGTYIVNGIDKNGCSNTAKVTIEVLLPLGIDEGINSQVNVYPNPSSDKVTVKIDYQGNTQIRLIDAMGNEKYSGSFKGSIEIPIQHFSAGVYFIQLNNTNTIKLLIQ